MAPIPALSASNAQHVIDDIDAQFQLKQDVLIELTKAFVEEYRLGLSQYGKAMAMM